MKLWAFGLFLFSFPACAATCLEEVGKKQSDIYVKDCLYLSASTHPPCNAANSCQVIIENNQWECSHYKENAPEICKSYSKVSSGRDPAAGCADNEKSPSSIGFEACANENFGKSDHLLNETYKEVISHLREGERDLKPLITAERAWIAERDARCDQRAKEMDLIDRTGGAVILDCKAEWTNARIVTLKDYLK